MSNTQSKKMPTHRVYAVTSRKGKSYWRAIGAGWQHEDGEGISIKLEYLPLNEADIVIRTAGEKDPVEDVAEGGAQ
jgi:hypothetical protein